MGNAKYIGRVGALAVALGIGTAVATTPWVAVAEPSAGFVVSQSSIVARAVERVVERVIERLGGGRRTARIPHTSVGTSDGEPARRTPPMTPNRPTRSPPPQTDGDTSAPPETPGTGR